MKVHLASLGCRLNRSEVERMARQFAAAGHTVVDDPRQADVCLVNTCAVTATAERKSRHLLSALHRANPSARLAAVGCYATLAPDRLSAMPGVAWVVSNADKEQAVATVMAGEPSAAGGERPRLHTRAFVKVQDGCDRQCAYCVIPALRGAPRSRPFQAILDEVQALVAEGYQEAVLSGVNLGLYGRDLGLKRGLADLVEALLAETELARLRLSSLEPWDLTGDLVGLWADPRLCRQLHLPLQSGCDETLQRMGRLIGAEEYAARVAMVRAVAPDLAVTTDVIVGFPGEDERAFVESLSFVERMGFAKVHVFPFSPRPGTPAARMEGEVPASVLRERAARMRETGARLAGAFRRRFLGREVMVLWEQRGSDRLWRGLSDNGLRVVTMVDGDSLHNRITLARPVAERGEELMAEVVG